MRPITELWFGIDPGLGRTGIVAATTEEVIEYATYQAGAGPDVLRAHSLAAATLDFVVRVVGERGPIDSISFAVELPIWKHNPKTFLKQVRVLQEIENQIYQLSLVLDDCTLFEISPTQSKKAATGQGNAGKDLIREACPLTLVGGLEQEPLVPLEDAEAIGDAWAHYKAAITGNYETCVRLTDVILDEAIVHGESL